MRSLPIHPLHHRPPAMPMDRQQVGQAPIDGYAGGRGQPVKDSAPVAEDNPLSHNPNP